MSKSCRISISLPTKLLSAFEEVLNRNEYSSRSSGIQDAMKSQIEQYESRNEIEGKHIGVISLIYDRNSIVLGNISNIQNELHLCINSILELRISNKQLMEFIIVKGDIKCVTKLSNKLMGIKGVEEVKLTSTFLNQKS